MVCIKIYRALGTFPWLFLKRESSRGTVGALGRTTIVAEPVD